jgi:hypothetical protein
MAQQITFGTQRKARKIFPKPKQKSVNLHLVSIACLVTCLAITNASAQSSVSPGVKTFMPPTPNAASLGKYGEIPVGLYNGIPEISIPLYTVKARGVDLPIGLSYHAGGIKVEEIASWVGLGWTLSAGGAITRSVRGMPDDFPGGYFTARNTIKTNALPYLNDNLTPATSLDIGHANGQPDASGSSLYVINAEAMVTDSEPDVFYFNFGGYSGKFFMDESGNFITSPQQDLRIEVIVVPGSAIFGVARWKATTPDGVEYIFGTSLDNRVAIDKNFTTTFVPPIITSWYLVEINTPYNDKISCHYESENYSYEAKEGETTNVLLESTPNYPFDNALGPNQKKIIQKIYEGVRLSRILSATSDLHFFPGSREDLVNSSFLQRMEIANSTGTLNKKIEFTYSYFQCTGSMAPSYDKRLRLDKIEETGGTAPNHKSAGKHLFEYDLTTMASWNPHSESVNSQDLWGYYNGTSNKVLTQSFKAETADGIYTAQGAKRFTSEVKMQAGILRKIIYPTGGFTEFHYEANRVLASDKDFQLLNIETVSKGQYLVINSGDGGKQLDFIVKDPDPLTGKIIMLAVARQQVQDCPSDPNGFPTCCNMYIEGINGTVYPKSRFKEGHNTLILDPGNYRISGLSDAFMESLNTKFPKTYYLQLNWEEYPPVADWDVKTNKAIGGLRIQRIVNQSTTGDITIKRYDYNKFGTNISSGCLINFPQSYATIFRVIYDSGGEFASEVKIGIYLQVRSYPQQALQPTKSAAIGYSNVTEYDGEYGENGKTEYVFTTALDYPDISKNYRPFAPPTSYDWRRGLLKQKTVYRFDGSNSTFKRIETVENDYLFDKNTKYAYGFAFERETFVHSQSSTAFLLNSAANYYISAYRLVGEFFFKNQERRQVFDPPGSSNSIMTTTDYNHGWQSGHFQLISKTVTNSDGTVSVFENKYPEDVTRTGDEEIARQLLITKFMKGTVLEQNESKSGVSISKTKNSYKVINSIPLLSTIDLQVGQNPIEQRVAINAYDNNGNILLQKKVSDVENSYIWGYNSTYAIAQVINAPNTQIAYTSFETNEAGNWSFSPQLPSATTGIARTGRKFLSLAAGTTISKSGLNSTSTYFVTYWSKNGSYSVNATAAVTGVSVNGWTYFSHKVINPAGGNITLTGSGSLDELRLYPANAQMTTYTYDPAVGPTDITDANNVTTYYEYDVVGRLKIVRDNNLKILKNMVYHFKGE